MLSVPKLYKYLANLYKLGVIPSFDVQVTNYMNELVFTTKYADSKWCKSGTSKIVYNINTKKWTGYTNTLTYDTIYNNYYYLIENNMISNNNNNIILESSNICDILEPSLNCFDNIYITSNKYLNIDLRNLVDINEKKIHNIDHRTYYIFIKYLIKHETAGHFYLYKSSINMNMNMNMNMNIPEHLWENIYNTSKPQELSYDQFLDLYL